MDPTIVNQAGWQLIDNTIAKLTIFVVLMVIGAFSIMLSRAILPSLHITGEIAEPFHPQRRILLGVGIIAFVLAIFQFVRVLSQAITLINAYYPHYGF